MNTKNRNIAASEGWHPELIKAAIRQKGITCEALSIRHGLHKSAVGRCLIEPWPRVERIIAAFLDRAPKDIWPSRYDPDGKPLRGRAEPDNHTPALNSAQRQKRRAA